MYCSLNLLYASRYSDILIERLIYNEARVFQTKAVATADASLQLYLLVNQISYFQSVVLWQLMLIASNNDKLSLTNSLFEQRLLSFNLHIVHCDHKAMCQLLDTLEVNEYEQQTSRLFLAILKLQRNQILNKIFLEIDVPNEPRNVKRHNLSKVAISQRSYCIHRLEMSYFHCWNIGQRLCHHLQCIPQSFKDCNKLFVSKLGHQWLSNLLFNLPILDNLFHTKRFGYNKRSKAVLFS